MGQVKIQDHPRGTPKDQGEMVRGGWIVRSVLCFVLWGGLSLGVLFQPISSMAKEPYLYSDDGIPQEISEYCELVGSEYDICPELLESMAYYESRFVPTVTNGKHYGLMQINVKIHKDRIEKYGWTEEDMFDAYKNLMVAADYLTELYKTYGDDNPIVLSVYSGNWKAVSKYKEYGFLSPYVDKVLTRSAEYERIHGK